MRALHRSLFRCATVGAAALLVGGRTARPPAAAPAEAPGLRALRIAVPVPARDRAAKLLLYVPRHLPAGEPMPAVHHLHGGSHTGTDLEKPKGYGPARPVARGGLRLLAVDDAARSAAASGTGY